MKTSFHFKGEIQISSETSNCLRYQQGFASSFIPFLPLSSNEDEKWSFHLLKNEAFIFLHFHFIYAEMKQGSLHTLALEPSAERMNAFTNEKNENEKDDTFLISSFHFHFIFPLRSRADRTREMRGLKDGKAREWEAPRGWKNEGLRRPGILKGLGFWRVRDFKRPGILRGQGLIERQENYPDVRVTLNDFSQP